MHLVFINAYLSNSRHYHISKVIIYLYSSTLQYLIVWACDRCIGIMFLCNLVASSVA